MQELLIDRISKQFEVLSSLEDSCILRHCIEPKKTERMITYQNDVEQGTDERSLKSQKYFNYCKQYIAFFQCRSYQFLFEDYSLGRFVYEFDERNILNSASLYWNPCPLNIEFILELENSGFDIMEYIDSFAEKEKIELDYISLRTPIRLDYTRDYDDKNIEYHPKYHIHYQHKDTRATTKNILSLYGYMLFILENCYPLFYRENEEKIERLRKLEKESLQGFKIGRSKNNEMGKKIHTYIGLE